MGTGDQHSGSRAVVISNHAYGYLNSSEIAVQPNTTYHLSVWLRGEIDSEESYANWILRAYYYDANHSGLSYTNVDLSSTAPSNWTERGGDFTTPANAAYVRVQLYNYMNSGWVAWDDVSLTGAGVTTRKYYYAGATRVAMRENDDLYFLLGDHLGSTAVTADADADGGKHAELRYKAWGENRDSGYSSGDTPTERHFTGQIEDGTIGLYFYNARYYDASLGRFVQADTIVPNPVDPQSLNRYSYVLNNPLRYTDPSGHWYYDPGADALVDTGEGYNEWPENLYHEPLPPKIVVPNKAACDALAGTSSPCKGLRLLPAINLPEIKRWGIRLDLTASFIVGIDLNFELTTDAEHFLKDLKLTTTVNAEIGNIGVGGSFGPVLFLEESEPSVPFSVAPIETGQSVELGLGFEFGQAFNWETGDLEALYGGVAFGVSAGPGYADVDGLTVDWGALVGAVTNEVLERLPW